MCMVGAPWPHICGYLGGYIYLITFDMSNEVVLICDNYYEVIDNYDCGVPDTYVLIELGPYHSYDEITRIESMDDELPF